MSYIYNTVHSKYFIDKWKELIKEVFYFREKDDFLIIPSMFFGKTLSYLPCIDYSDKLVNNVDNLLSVTQNYDYRIKVLNPSYLNFNYNDTVVMRLGIKNCTSEKIFMNNLHKNCRKKVRQSIKRNKFEIIQDRDIELINHFYPLYLRIMHKHGNLPKSKEFFKKIIQKFESEVLIVKLNNKTVSGSILIFDKTIACLFISVINYDFSKTKIGYFSFWKCLESVINKKEYYLFDFGRSSYGGNTFKFKSQWGAIPVKVDILMPKECNIYSKYYLVSRIWKKLPSYFVDYVGPKLCRYISDI